MDTLLDMAYTEGIGGEGITDREGKPVIPETLGGGKYSHLPSIQFDLELIEKPDGSYVWVED